MGSQVQDKPHPLTLSRMDGWASNVTGLGGIQDKGASLFHRKDAPISRALAESLWSDSGIGGAIVEEKINDAFSPGWQITLPATTDKQEQRDNAAKAADINGRLTGWHDRTGFVSETKRHKGQTGAYGGSVLLFGVDDGNESTEAIGDVKSFDWVKTFDRYEASGSGSPVTDPASPHFAFPAHYLIGTILAGQTGQSETARQLQFSNQAIQERSDPLRSSTSGKATSQIAHASRLWRSDGPYLSHTTRLANGGWGNSAFQRVVDSVNGWDSTQANVRHIVQDFVSVVYGVEGFQQLIHLLQRNEATDIQNDYFAL